MNSTIRQAKRLVERPDTASIELAKALWKAERTQPGSVRQLVAETGLGIRKAYYLLKIWERFAGLDVSRDLLAEIGWTKLKRIASCAPAGAEAIWLELARSRITAKELEGRLKGGAWGKPKGHSVLLRLSASQYRTFARVLQQFGAKPARKGKGLVDKEGALIRALNQIDG